MVSWWWWCCCCWGGTGWWGCCSVGMAYAAAKLSSGLIFFGSLSTVEVRWGEGIITGVCTFCSRFIQTASVLLQLFSSATWENFLNDKTLCTNGVCASNNHCSLLNKTHWGNAHISNLVTVFAVFQLLTEGFKGTSWIILLLQSTRIMFCSLKANSPAPAAATISLPAANTKEMKPSTDEMSISHLASWRGCRWR